MATAIRSADLSRSAPAAAPVAVRVDHLVKRFAVRRTFREILRSPFRTERTTALNDVSCEIREGEFFGLLGANGAGKTTLFKILATLVIPDGGTATVAGFDVTRSAAHVRRVLTPVIADERSLRWRLSARENLRLFATLYGLHRADIDDRVEQTLRVVGLDQTDRKLVGRFSSGMKQRLLIGRALIPRPRVLLLDEPTRSLDPVAARKLRAFLRQDICRGLGCTVLLATHSSEEAFEMCDRIAILDQGSVVAVGEPERLMLDFSEDRYRLWTTTPRHPAIESMVTRGLATDLVVFDADHLGWTALEIAVPGGLSAAAKVVAYLAEHGVVVARFERVRLSLGELIQRVLTKREESGA